MKRGTPTRYKELRYERFGRAHWQFVDAESGAQVGPFYGTRAELLADFERYASLFGCRGAGSHCPCGAPLEFAEDQRTGTCERCRKGPEGRRA